MLILEEIIDSFSLWEASGKVPHTSKKVPKFDQLIERRYREGTGKVPGRYREIQCIDMSCLSFRNNGLFLLTNYKYWLKLSTNNI